MIPRPGFEPGPIAYKTTKINHYSISALHLSCETALIIFIFL